MNTDDTNPTLIHLTTFVNKITSERERQEVLHRDKNLTNTLERWMIILGEEYGEVCAGVQSQDMDNIETELFHVATVCFAIYQRIQEGTLYAISEVELLDARRN